MSNNLYDNLPVAKTDEIFTDLLKRPDIRIERIVSDGQISPADYWYEQAEMEWILLLRGQAKIRFEDEATDILLTPGSYLLIEAGRRHRVTFTAPDTIWLAVWFSESS